MSRYDREDLKKVLHEHGYKIDGTISPEWCAFAIQILQTEYLVQITEIMKRIEYKASFQ